MSMTQNQGASLAHKPYTKEACLFCGRPVLWAGLGAPICDGCDGGDCGGE
jgi:hypothetical protein